MASAAAASRLANPFAGDVPTKVETRLSLDNYEFCTISFNSRGTYLAAGSTRGDVVIWDLVTLTPALVLNNLHATEVSFVSWVRKGKGRLVCTISPDGWLKIVDLETRSIFRSLYFADELIGASVHPESLQECLVCLGPKEPNQVPWPGLYSLNNSDTTKPMVTYIPPEKERPKAKCLGVAATFSRKGNLIFVGGTHGAVHAFVTRTGEYINVFHPETTRGLPTKTWILSLHLSQNGKVLLCNGGGKLISMFEVANDSLCDAHDSLPGDAPVGFIQDAMRWRVGKVLSFKRHVQDVVGSTKWTDICCSGQAEFVLGASSTRDVHELYVWDVTGQLVNIVKDSIGGNVLQSVWHPWRPQVATVVAEGTICLWGSSGALEDKSWLAFAPGFVEIEENEVFTETNARFQSSAPLLSSQPCDEGDTKWVDVDVNVMDADSFPQTFSDNEDSDPEEPSKRLVPRKLSRGIGYFIQATTDYIVTDGSKLPSFVES